jgi:hypothetical protein
VARKVLVPVSDCDAQRTGFIPFEFLPLAENRDSARMCEVMRMKRESKNGFHNENAVLIFRFCRLQSGHDLLHGVNESNQRSLVFSAVDLNTYFLLTFVMKLYSTSAYRIHRELQSHTIVPYQSDFL